MGEDHKISLVLSRDLKVFKKLFNTYYSDLVGFTASIIYDEDEAVDIVQEIFYHLWDHAEEINITTSLKHYLFTAARNKALNLIKHYRIRDKHENGIREAFLMAGEADSGLNEERLDMLMKAVEDLPPQMKKVITLKVSSGKQYSEIAEDLGLSINTVKTHMKRAMDILRKNLLGIWFLLIFL